MPDEARKNVLALNCVVKGARMSISGGRQVLIQWIDYECVRPHRGDYYMTRLLEHETHYHIKEELGLEPGDELTVTFTVVKRADNPVEPTQ